MLSKSLEETKKIAADFVKTLSGKETATFVGLHGDLGSGKTSFTQGVAEALGVTVPVQSPTYVIMKSYDINHPIFKKLIHIDAYRLESGDELSKLGFAEIISDPHNLILLEWPERVESVLPKDYLRIDFEFVDENTRKIELRVTS